MKNKKINIETISKNFRVFKRKFSEHSNEKVKIGISYIHIYIFQFIEVPTILD